MEILTLLELIGKYPTLITSVLSIIAEAPTVIPELVTFLKAPSWAALETILSANTTTSQKLMAAVNTTAQADPTFIPAVVSVIKGA